MFTSEATEYTRYACSTDQPWGTSACSLGNNRFVLVDSSSDQPSACWELGIRTLVPLLFLSLFYLALSPTRFSFLLPHRCFGAPIASALPLFSPESVVQRSHKRSGRHKPRAPSIIEFCISCRYFGRRCIPPFSFQGWCLVVPGSAQSALGEETRNERQPRGGQKSASWDLSNAANPARRGAAFSLANQAEVQGAWNIASQLCYRHIL